MTQLSGGGSETGPRPSRGRFGLIGRSPAMQEIYRIIDRVADTPSTVLVTGESGTGKELIARALHEHSARRDQPLIRVNCAALPKELIESELFGYEKGAFTGAVSGKPGRFELADKGTLFLDEIGEIPVNMQVKLLRAIQESEFERVGGVKTLRVDVRLVAATNRSLVSEIAEGRFREDLYYRLNVVQVHLPPLRERADDIPLLVDHFLEHFNVRLRRQVKGMTLEALDRLRAHAWRGNIRELENAIERCVLFCDQELVGMDSLPPEIMGELTASEPPETRAVAAGKAPSAAPFAAEGPADGSMDLKAAVREATTQVERQLIERALSEAKLNVTHAARLLKISRKSLQIKMKELGLRKRH